MQVNDPVWFKDLPCSTALAEQQSLAIGDDLGIVVSLEDRDGAQYANVLFPVYGALFSGILVSDLQAYDQAPYDPEAPKSLFSRIKSVFTG